MRFVLPPPNLPRNRVLIRRTPRTPLPIFWPKVLRERGRALKPVPSRFKNNVVHAGSKVRNLGPERAEKKHQGHEEPAAKEYDFSAEFLELETRRAAQAICDEDPELTRLENEDQLYARALEDYHNREILAVEEPAKVNEKMEVEKSQSDWCMSASSTSSSSDNNGYSCNQGATPSAPTFPNIPRVLRMIKNETVHPEMFKWPEEY